MGEGPLAFGAEDDLVVDASERSLTEDALLELVDMKQTFKLIVNTKAVTKKAKWMWPYG